MIGTIFLDRYQINGILGQGGMGVVYQARDRLLERDVAVKILNKSALSSEGRSRMLHEAQSAARLNHPNIVTIYDAGESEGVPFIILEYIEGRSLHEKPPRQLQEILAMASQVCMALEHAYSRGIVHRDLKPENVLVTPEGEIKLTDFGLARSVSSRLTAEGSITGSVLYLAPELALGQAFDGRADLYALGVMLYEFATGQLPFTASDPLAIISQHLNAPPVPPRLLSEQIPAALDALILKLMGKRAEDRPATAREVLEALERIEAGEVEASAEWQSSPLERIARGRLIGREQALAEAVQVWNRASTVESAVLLISGEPGIGKSRLACELISQAQVRGAIILSGDCYAEGNAPYAPAAQIIEAAAGFQDFDSLASLPELVSLAPGLRLRYPQARSNQQLEPQAEQARLYESFVELVAALSTRAPVLVFLEDAHWADSGTLSLLRHLARRASRLKLRLMILMTYREVELDESNALSQVLYDFTRERLGERIKLSRLDRQQTGEMLAALLGEEVSSEFLGSVYQETEGNPFFIEEVCKALVEQGKLRCEEGCWRWPKMEEVEIPQSIKVAIQARIGGLPVPAQDLLRTASIFGREFDFQTLQEISDLDEETLVEALESAERAQVVYELRQAGKARAYPTFAFAHALVSSTLREGLSGLRRQRLHLRAALALERLHPDRLEELAQQLGKHFAEAGEWERAAGYLLQAGDRARQVYAYPEAIGLYQQALAILKEEQDFERAARTLMKLGLLYHARFNFKASREAYQEGFALWKQAGEKQPVPSPPASRPLRLGWNEPLTLDPSIAYEATSMPVINQLFVGLVSLTPDLDVVPELAQSWEVLEDGLKYLFHLRGDARWTDGEPVTAFDLEFAWKRILNPETGSRNAILFYDICGARDYHEGKVLEPDQVGIRALDAATLEVELEQPAGYFLHLLTYGATYPVPRHAVQAKGKGWSKAGEIVSNGPFCLTEWAPGESILLTRNHDYFGRFDGNLRQVELSFKPELSRLSGRLAAYEAGRLDVCAFGGQPAEADRARQRHAGEYATIPSASVTFLVLDTSRPPLDDVRIRRAFVHALDREMLAEVCYRGYVHPATAGMVPPWLPGQAQETGLPFDPDRARRLLAEAGYPNGKGFPALEVWLITPETSQLIEFIHDQWLENLGIESHWETMKEKTMYSRLAKERPPVLFNGWLADYPDPDSFLRLAIAFQTRWRNPEYEQLVETARRETDQAARMQMYRQVERILIEEVPLIPLFYGKYHLLVKPWVRRYLLSPIQPLILKDVVLEE